jgi:hypothetical protein
MISTINILKFPDFMHRESNFARTACFFSGILHKNNKTKEVKIFSDLLLNQLP